MKTIKSKGERKTDSNITRIKNAVKRLRKRGFKIKIDKDVETLFGSLVDNVYVVDTLSNGKVIFQKHLFTVERR